MEDTSRKDSSRKLTEDLPNTITQSLKTITLGEQFQFHSCDIINSGKNSLSLCLEVLPKWVLDIPQQSQVGFRPLKQHEGCLKHFKMSKFIIVIPAWRPSSPRETLVFAGFSHFFLKDAGPLVFLFQVE